jgi:hypothetical protein
MSETYSPTIRTSAPTFTLNQQGDAQPWGTRENTLLKAIIDTLEEIYDDDGNPTFTLTAAHATDYDPQIQFRTDATPTVKWSLGVDAANDNFSINSGTGVGGATTLAITTADKVGVGTASPGSLFHVYKGDSQASAPTDTNLTVETGENNNYISLLCDQTLGPHTQGILIGNHGDNDAYRIITDGDSPEQLQFWIAGARQIDIKDGSIIPNVDSDIDLGESTKYFKTAYVDRYVSQVATLSATGPTDDQDLSGVSVLEINTNGNNVTLGGATGGVDGQILHIVIVDASNNTIVEHAEGVGQSFYLNNGADHTLTGVFGGWTFICNGTHWYEVGNTSSGA